MRACNHTGTQLLCPTQRQWFATQTSQHVRFCSRHGVLAWMAYASGVPQPAPGLRAVRRAVEAAAERHSTARLQERGHAGEVQDSVKFGPCHLQEGSGAGSGLYMVLQACGDLMPRVMILRCEKEQRWKGIRRLFCISSEMSKNCFGSHKKDTE